MGNISILKKIKRCLRKTNHDKNFNFQGTPDELTALLLESKDIKSQKLLFPIKIQDSQSSQIFFYRISKNQNDIYYLNYIRNHKQKMHGIYDDPCC